MAALLLSMVVSTDQGMDGPSERSLWIGVLALALLVGGLVALVAAFPQALRLDGLDVTGLPRVHAAMNGTTALLLTAGYVAIRTGRRKAHICLMSTSFVLSCLFLISYVTYHSQAPQSHFGGVGWIRPAYFFILVTHISLAPVLVPFVLFTLARAIRGELVRHRRLARWTLPIWMYVAVTGVLVYVMMAPYYPS